MFNFSSRVQLSAVGTFSIAIVIKAESITLRPVLPILFFSISYCLIFPICICICYWFRKVLLLLITCIRLCEWERVFLVVIHTYPNNDIINVCCYTKCQHTCVSVYAIVTVARPVHSLIVFWNTFGFHKDNIGVLVY